MPVVIREIVSEVVVGRGGEAQAPAPTGGGLDDAQVELVVRRAVERVLERLRREWEQ